MVEPSPYTRVGTVIGGRYRLLAVLGRGGMGILYTAEHLLTQRRVALKLVKVEPDCDPVELELRRTRFLVEARAAAAKRHPCIVDVLDMGFDDDGSPFLALELLEGIALDGLLAERKRMPPEETLTTLLPIIGALATLHDAGIVHRDVKPSNIFLHMSARKAFAPKLLDFGLAHTFSDVRLTRSGMAMGTPLYMAPEQAAGEVVGPAADVWSMGVVIYECLAGCSPFLGSDGQILTSHVRAARVRPLTEAAPHVPLPLACTVERALRRDVLQRFGSMRELAQSLVAAAKACDLTIPPDPDPVGLPDIRSWEHNPGALINTVSAAAAIVRSVTAESQSHARDLAPTPAYAHQDPVWVNRRRRGLWLGASVIGGLALGGLALAAYGWASAIRQTPEVAELPSASVRAPVTASREARVDPREPVSAPAPNLTSRPSAEPVQGGPSPSILHSTPAGKAHELPTRHGKRRPNPMSNGGATPAATPADGPLKQRAPAANPFEVDREWL